MWKRFKQFRQREQEKIVEMNVSNFKELPDEVQHLLQQLNFSEEQIDSNFVAVCRSVNFCYGKHFKVLLNYPGKTIKKLDPLQNSPPVQLLDGEKFKPIENNEESKTHVDSENQKQNGSKPIRPLQLLNSVRQDLEAIKSPSNFKNGRHIGSGGYGTVFKVKNQRNQKSAARKTVKKNVPNAVTSLLNEICFLKFLEHPNILKLIDYVEDKQNISMITEYLDGGSLEFLLKRKAELNEGRCAHICREVLQGLLYLRQNKIIHRDIKPENICITQNASVKIVDFGLAVDCEETGGNLPPNSPVCGTWMILSPEMINGDSIDSYHDVFGLGICLLNFVGYKPEYALSWMFNISKTANPMFPNPIDSLKKCTPNQTEFLKMIFQFRSNRSNHEQLLKSKFIANSESQFEMVKFCQAVFLAQELRGLF